MPEANTTEAGEITLRQTADGTHWQWTGHSLTQQQYAEDMHTVENSAIIHELVFMAQPDIHRFPWEMEEGIDNKHVVIHIKRQPFKKYQASQSSMWCWKSHVNSSC
ncbi:hypothetical protein JG687_00018682 [Phytophthora cactorum]|uniref:Uncharacterized protein n=1 Tax=Phytophthora cactorum TaxID=29920 RepID=A0A329RGS2_9STRA|nr:hypothetical protein Pcac1_g20090 [Phytophthora cactorum]KAG2835595.1 hypothetical protein PC113_g20187 [Phytophthora cactorum]KAG2880076.1 hypothetical protein PC114_g22247 [Phytophthora cactorum]KAG2889198.1 hypothetical protein PC115_g19816 [Phytophthora cactorum]KAG2900106.1 hypothetical protein PC117_g22066 [Phytophthora cactorum]